MRTRAEEILELFAEAQGSVSAFRRVAPMMGPQGSMSIVGHPFRLPVLRATASVCYDGVAFKPKLCLSCGQLPQQFNSCRCAACDKGRRKRRPVTLAAPKVSPE